MGDTLKSKCHVCGGEVHPVPRQYHEGTAILHSYNVLGRGERIEFCSMECAMRWSDKVGERYDQQKQAN